MKLYYVIILVIIGAVVAGLSYTYLSGLVKAEKYLVIAHFPPHLSNNLDKALEEVRSYSQWASWYGSVSLPLRKYRDMIRELMDTRGFSSEEYDKSGGMRRIHLYKLRDRYIVEVRRNGDVVFNYTTNDLEDAFWTLIEVGKRYNISSVEAVVFDLVNYKYDLPLLYGAFAIPFCNNTYYGPRIEPFRVVLDGAIEINYFIENRTIKPIRLPKAVTISGVVRVGDSWLGGHYVIDACVLPGVRREGIIAIVSRGNLEKVVAILERYTGEKPLVQPIS